MKKNLSVIRQVRGLMSRCLLNWSEMRRLTQHVRRGGQIIRLREPHGKTVQWVSVVTSYASHTFTFHFSM